jgi:hypothetical protein
VVCFFAGRVLERAERSVMIFDALGLGLFAVTGATKALQFGLGVCALHLLGIGGIDPDNYRRAADAGRVSQDIPVNHSPTFPPVVQPTLDTGTQAMVSAALAWLS